MNRIVWLASYPKSGNTWFRTLLANLAPGRAEPAEINRLGAAMASSRIGFDRATGVEAADLTFDEIDRLRPRVHACPPASGGNGEPRFYKIHDAFPRPADGEPIIAVDATRGALYLVRNPLDVCVSYAHHSSWEIDTTIARMQDDSHSFSGQPDRLDNQLRQHLSSWSGHVRGWLDNGRVPVHPVRYEDLMADPVETVAAALVFAGMRRARAEIERAVEWSRLDRLQAQERTGGFCEKPATMGSFFRRGAVGGWRDELTAAQAARIVGDHDAVMRRLGYHADASA